MSITLTISAHAPKSKKGFEVEYQEACMIVRGAVPVDVFTALASTMPDGSVMSARLAKRFDTSFVAGLPENLERLSAVAPATPLRVGAERLPKDAVGWLQTGERGASSEAMFDAVFGGHFAASHAASAQTPGDVSDFARCRLLAEQVADVALHLDRVASLSVIWRRIVSAWPQICETLNSEAADYHVGMYTAPQTAALIESLCGSDKS